MTIYSNKVAGIIAVNNLPQKAIIEIRDLAGMLVRTISTITPSFTLDSETLDAGTYDITAKSSEGIKTIRLQVV